MGKGSPARRPVTAAQRGQIVQLVIVEGWSAERAAATFDIDARLIRAWVAAYRRDGMASLHRNPSDSFAGTLLDAWLLRPLSSLVRTLGAGPAIGRKQAAAPSPLPSRDDRRRGG